MKTKNNKIYVHIYTICQSEYSHFTMSKTMTSKKQPSKKQNRNKRNNKQTVAIDRVQPLRVIRVRDIMPPRIVTRLKYIVLGILQNNTGVTASRQMNANGIYDVDPAIASTSVPGFAEFSGFYNRYRVFKVKSTCIFINNEGFPLVANLGFEAIPFASNGKTIAYYEMHNQKTTLIPRTQTAAGLRLTMTKRDIDIVGDAVVLGSLNYTGTLSSNPASLWYTTISVSSQGVGLPLTLNGVSIRWEIEFDVEFFELKNINA